MNKKKKQKTDETILTIKDEITEQVEVESEATDIENADVKDEELDPQTEIEILSAELKHSQSLADENLDGWQRSRAEFANYKKRIERDAETSRARISGEIILRFLDPFDDLERALQEKPAENDISRWMEGIQLIYQKYLSILEVENVTTIPAKGLPFDPTLHEALTYEECEDVEEGIVIDIFQPGYRIGERIIRPARVRVAK